IAGSCRIHDFLNRMCLDDMNLIALDDHAARFRARQRRTRTVLARALHRLIEIRDLIERFDLSLIGKEDIDVAANEFKTAFVVTAATEGGGGRDRTLTAGLAGNARRLLKGFLGERGVPEITLKIVCLGPSDHRLVDIAGR